MRQHNVFISQRNRIEFMGNPQSYQFLHPGYYHGQVLLENLVLAEFSLTAGTLNAPYRFTLDLGRPIDCLNTHMEIAIGGHLAFQFPATTPYAVVLARSLENRTSELVYDSRLYGFPTM